MGSRRVPVCDLPLVAMLFAAVSALVAVAQSRAADDDPAAILRARYEELRPQLEHSPFQQPVHIESVDERRSLRGDVYAVVDYPVATVSDALTRPAGWCDALILHLNIKYCRPVQRDGVTALSVAIGRKHDQPIDSAYRVEFMHSVVASQPDYLAVELKAKKGPVGTSNYQITLEAAGLDGGRSVLHLRYSYAYGFWARVGTQLYLRGPGHDKVGFTTTGAPGAPEPTYIDGLRGILERNVMRNYLAIDAYLGTAAAPAADRLQQSLERWFDATERYARQLHELERDDYLAMKRREYERQQTSQ